MTRAQILPVLLILIDLGAAAGYIGVSWWKVGYWVFAAGLTICVTFGR